MSYDKEKIRLELQSLAEIKYQQFAAALIPGCSNMLGVRIPLLRQRAQQIIKEQGVEAIRTALATPDVYLEETLLIALMIGQLKENIELVLELSSQFIPRIHNWSVCDTFCQDLKITQQHKKRVWAYLQPYANSQKPYEIRVAMVMFLRYFREEAYLEKLFYHFNHVNRHDYYVRMAVAWAVSWCFIKFPEQTLSYLQHNKLDDDTFHKALAKIRESQQVSFETKVIIKSMKRGSCKDQE